MQIIAPRSNQKVIKKQMHVKHKINAVQKCLWNYVLVVPVLTFADMFMESGIPNSSIVIFANTFMIGHCCKCITHANALMASWLFGTFVYEVEDFEMNITGYLDVCLRHQLGKIYTGSSTN